jgi:hypothetical protein
VGLFRRSRRQTNLVRVVPAHAGPVGSSRMPPCAEPSHLYESWFVEPDARFQVQWPLRWAGSPGARGPLFGLWLPGSVLRNWLRASGLGRNVGRCRMVSAGVRVRLGGCGRLSRVCGGRRWCGWFAYMAVDRRCWSVVVYPSLAPPLPGSGRELADGGGVP